MKPALLWLALVVVLASCRDATPRSSTDTKTVPEKQAFSPPLYPRFLPTGADPEVALDTQSGMLCRTVRGANSAELIGFMEAECEVTTYQKRLGLVPLGCKNGKTWVKADTAVKPASKYANLLLCDQTIYMYNPTTGKIERGNFDREAFPFAGAPLAANEK